MITNPIFVIHLSLQPEGTSKPFIFQALTILPNITHNLRYQRSMTSGCNDIEIKRRICDHMHISLELIQINL